MSGCSASSVTLKWSKVTGASGYTIYLKKGNNYKKVASTTKTSYKISKLSAGKNYQYKIHAYVKVGSKNYESKAFTYVNAGTLPKAPAISSVKSKYSKSAVVKIKKVTGATNYAVYYATSKKGKYKLAANTSSNTANVSGLKGGKTYYFKVKALRNISGKAYSTAFSSVKSAKIKK